MKDQFIRRAGALALVFSLTLSLLLSVSLAPPAWADPAPSESDGTESEPPSEPPDEPGEGEGDGDESAGLIIAGLSRWTSKTADSEKILTVTLTGDPEWTTQTIRWSAKPASVQAGAVAPTFSGTGIREDGTPGTVTGATVTVTDPTVTVNEQTAGVFDITAEYLEGDKVLASGTFTLTISGILLSGTTLNAEKKSLEMVENGSAALSATLVGDADDIYSGTWVEWTSNDPYVVSVMPDAGSLNAWHEGTATIYAAKDDYQAYCTVTVVADTSAVADEGYTSSLSDPLTLDKVYPRLKEICLAKTEALTTEQLPLEYITNLSVPTDQGTLYYNYIAESDTGSGVGANDRFTDPKTASGTIRGVDKLYFVPKPGFSGTAEITFTGIAKGNRNFSGVIKVSVGSSGGAYEISYRAMAGGAVWFSASDFDAWCRSVNGRSYSYIIFNMPGSSEGTLYYNYTVKGSGNPVTAGIRFSQSGEYTIDDVCFVPNAAYDSKEPVTIGFRAVDTSGAAFDGELTVRVTAANAGEDPSNVTVAGKRGQPVTLQSSMFLDACQGTIHDTLAFVIFRLPDPSEGVLYCNYRSDGTYDSRVTAGTRCYYSGTPGLDSVSFVPAPGVADRIAISYTGYGSGGASYGGTLYIVFEEADRSDIHYSVPKGGSVTFNVLDFNSAGLYAVGSSVGSVVFTKVTGTDLGSLYYNYQSSSSYHPQMSLGTRYYCNSSYSPRLNLISFHAGNKAGFVTITYDAYFSNNSTQKLFTGTLVIQVGSPTPDDVNLSCKTSEEAQLKVSAVDSVCGAVMNKGLSYIEITGVPAAKMGHLYYNYNGVGTGTAVTQGDRFYCIGSPNIDRLKFVPLAGFSGEAEITYIGYSYDRQEQVSGRIVVNVTKSTDSVFKDMDGYKWAIDSVNYLYHKGTVAGIGNGRFDPGGTVTRGDFTLMLVNAYGLTAAGSASFSDVPASKYYADAIRVASLLGIVGGVGNGNFAPDSPLARQDAMVIIYNVLKLSGKTATNGLAADFSAYRDEKEIAPYAREAMGTLIQMGVVGGDGNGNLSPRRHLNRAEVAVLLHKIMTL